MKSLNQQHNCVMEFLRVMATFLLRLHTTALNCLSVTSWRFRSTHKAGKVWYWTLNHKSTKVPALLPKNTELTVTTCKNLELICFFLSPVYIQSPGNIPTFRSTRKSSCLFWLHKTNAFNPAATSYYNCPLKCSDPQRSVVQCSSIRTAWSNNQTHSFIAELTCYRYR